MSKKEIVNIHKTPDGIFEIECYEKPLRTQIAELEQKNKQLEEQLAIKDRMVMLILKNTYYLDKEYFIEEIPTQDEYIVSQTKYWTEQAKESMK